MEVVREWFSPYPRENGYKKDDFIADCPDLWEPVVPHSHSPPPPPTEK